MFSKSSAPFFHYGQNLPFPEFEKPFIKHLARVFAEVTNRKISEQKLWDAFIDLSKVPQLVRGLVERLALNPSLTIPQAKTILLHELYDDRAFTELWEHGSSLERLLMKAIALGESGFFTEDCRTRFAKQLGITKLPVTTVQSSLRTLTRKQIIGRIPDSGKYYLEDPNFKDWLLQIK